MSLIKEIFKWATDLPDWQQDIIRRIFEKPSLSNEDKSEALLNLMNSNGITLEGFNNYNLIPLENSALLSNDELPKKVVLKKLYQTKNANKLKDGEELCFNETGLTIIFGQNASGKSGYARILKRACKSRDAGRKILPNVYNKGAVILDPASAIFDIEIDGNAVSERWVDNEISPPSLSSIAVFDSGCARVYVNDKTEVDYLPYGADVLLRLVECFEELKIMLKGETPLIQDLPYEFNQALFETSVEPLIKKIYDPEILRQVLEVGRLTAEENENIAKLEISIAQSKLTTPKALADSFTRKKQRYINLKNQLKSINDRINNEAIVFIKTTVEEFFIAIESAKVASEVTFTGEPLPGVGSEVWKLLFFSAKKYSEEFAYPGKEFPCIGMDDYCVLCQQNLDYDASKRFKRFDEFIKNESAIAVQALQNKLNSISKDLQSINFLCFDSSLEIEKEIESECPELHKEILTYLDSAKAIYGQIIKAIKDNAWPNLLFLESDSIFSKLQENIDCLEDKIQENLSPTPINPAENLEHKAYKELKIRQLINKFEREIIGYSSNLLKSQKLIACHDALDTTKITKKQTSLLNDAVTENLYKGLKRELESLGADEIKLTLIPSGSKGKLSHRILFEGIKDISPSNVLSEGEERIVAIASFLAELNESSHSSGIVFDDPVSSLDHRWRDKVAERLVKEAKNKQVIIFTHDLVFLLALSKQAEWQSLNEENILVQSIESNKSYTGLIIENPPYTSRVKKQIGILKQLLPKAKLFYEKGGSIYDPFIITAYNRLRATWEQTIEEVVLNETVLRFRYGVATQSLKKVVETIKPDDYNIIAVAMSKCSEVTDAHNTSPAAYGSMPSPTDLEQDIQVLADFVNEFRKR